MTDYTQTTDFSAKDSLPTGTAAKKILGSEVDTELSNIATATNSKVDKPGSETEGDILVYRSSVWTNEAAILPVGLVLPYAGTSEPTNWLFCDGRSVSDSTYSVLFAVLGTTYGNSGGAGTFDLPDLRFRVPVGADDMGTAAGAASRDTGTTYSSGTGNEGSEGGANTHTLVEGEIPAHAHGVTPGTYLFATTTLAVDGNATNVLHASGSVSNTFASYGGSGAHENMPPFTVMNYIIRYQ